MKAIVLAGGHATRLWPLTRHRAKPLLPLAGKPIICYVLDQLQALAGVDEVLISTNAKFADDFKAFITEHEYEAVQVVVEDHTREDEKIGSLGAMMQVMDDHGRDEYLVIGGDNYLSLDLGAFVDAAADHDAMTAACFELEDRSEAVHFGVVGTDEDNRITRFEEKPDEPFSRLASTLVYYFPAGAAELFAAYRKAHVERDVDHLDEPGRLIEWAYTRYPVYAYPFTGEWFDIGTPENYLQAQAELSDGQQDGDVTDCEIGANVWIMEDAVVEDSVLEDCIVFPGSHIRDVRLQSCIIDEQATVCDTRLHGAVIGAHSKVSGDDEAAGL